MLDYPWWVTRARPPAPGHPLPHKIAQSLHIFAHIYCYDVERRCPSLFSDTGEMPFGAGKEIKSAGLIVLFQTTKKRR